MLREYLCCSLCKWNDKTMIPKAQQSRWHGGLAPLILTLPLDGGELCTSHPGCFTPSNEPRYSLRTRLCGPQYRSIPSNEPRYSLRTRLCGPQQRSGRFVPRLCGPQYRSGRFVPRLCGPQYRSGRFVPRLCGPQYRSGRFVPTENRTADRPAHSHYID